MKELDLTAFEQELANLTLKPGLLFGPGATRPPGELALEYHKVFSALGISDLLGLNASDADCPAAIDAAFEARADKQEVLKHALLEKLRSLKPVHDLDRLVRAGWSAYVSLTEDLLLEEALRNYADGLPSSKPVTIVDHPFVEPPSRSYPVYKLLGNLNNPEEESTVCLSDSELHVRRQSWSGIVSSLTNYLREAPLFVLGFDSNTQRLSEVLGFLAAQQHPRVTRLRFLKQDPALNSPTVKAILKKFDVAIVDGSVRDLCERISSTRTQRSPTTQLAPEKSAFRLVQDMTNDYDCPIAVVPHFSSPPLNLSRMELSSSVDSLFRPASPDWRPYLASLDLRRDCTDSVIGALKSQIEFAKPGSPRVVLLVGEAGVGKTTLAKRVALEMSVEPTLVLWCRRTGSGNWLRAFRKWLDELFIQLKKSHEKHYQHLLLVCDDPWALRIEAPDVLAAIERAPIPATLLAVFRTTDRHVSELRSMTAETMSHKDIEVPHELSDAELERLSTMLHRIGAETSLERAKDLVRTVPTKHAKDILCSLWYLVPETKSQLADSLKDEYFRLGQVAGISDLAQSSALDGKTAHKAYEYVTVSSRLGIGLPVEVLVHALGIDYADWIGSLEKGRPLWGLLYDEPSGDGSTISYFTRNEVVTRVLIDLVNGGLAGHMGEVRVLKELIQACHSPAASYRGFLVDVLVRGRSELSKIFTYEQGCGLYEAALESRSSEDRLLEHHFGIWIQDKGPRDGSAYRQLEKALSSSTPSGSDRDAPREHIHASMAAAVLKQISNGNLSWKAGAELVRSHLQQASSPTFFNAHTSHVAANLLFEAAQLAKQSQDRDTEDKFTIAAFEEIERAFHIVGARSKTSFQYNKTLGMLGDLQHKILGLIPDIRQLKARASELFEKKRTQIGFQLAARRLLVEATQTGKGRDFNDVNDYLNECMTSIEDAAVNPAADLLAVRTDLMVRWKLHGFRENSWEAFRDDLIDILEDARFSDDVLKHFYLAVAYFHTSQIAEANATFSQLRRESANAHRPNDIRAYFQDAKGNPRRFQATARHVMNRVMVSIPELQIDAPLRTGGPGHGVIHVYVGFSFNGPIAVTDTPEPSDLSLY